MQVLSGVLATLLALFTGRPSVLPEAAPPATIEEAMAYVCHVRELDCTSIPPPGVALFWSQHPEAPLAGFDWDVSPDHVLVNYAWAEHAPWQFVETVIVHEISHYVDYRLGLLEDTVESICASEARAWHVYHAWAIYRGYGPELVDVRYDWLDQYAHCR